MEIQKSLSKTAIYRQCTVTLTAGVCSFLIGCAIGWTAPASIKYQHKTSPIKMTMEETSWLGVVNEVGRMLSPIPGGMIADKYGRILIFILCGLTSSIGWSIIIFAKSLTLIYISRFILGISMGLASCAIYPYAGEISTPAIRCAVCLLPLFLFNVGLLFQYAIGEYLSCTNVAIVTSAISILYLGTLYFIPESPYFLLSISKEEKAIKNYSWFQNTKDEEKLKQFCFNTNVNNHGFLMQVKNLLTVLSNLKSMGTILAICFLTEFTGRIPILIYATNIFEFKNNDDDDSADMTPGQYVILLGVIQMLTTFVPFFLADRIGRVPLLLVSSISAGICHILTVVSFSVSSNSWFRFVTVTGYIFCTGIGMAPIAAASGGDLLPPSIRGIGCGIHTAAFAISSILSSKFFYIIWHAFSMQTVFIVFTFNCFLVTFYSYFYFPEAKGSSIGKIQGMSSFKEKEYLPKV